MVWRSARGVLICPDRESAVEAVASMMKEAKFGASGARVVIEEFLTGPEVSVLVFTDGKTVKPMVSSMDHKRALDHDEGLNTGGMGTIAPNPCYTPELAQRCMDEIFLPTIAAMNAEGRTFTGCLYFGLMMTPKGPKVIEYNCRFGDPETQVVLPLLKSDLLTIMRATVDGTLADTPVEFASGAACCVVLASGGYPVSYKSGYPISGLMKRAKPRPSSTRVRSWSMGRLSPRADAFWASPRRRIRSKLRLTKRIRRRTKSPSPTCTCAAILVSAPWHHERRAIHERQTHLCGKESPYAVEAKQLLWEIRHILQIKTVTGLRLLNRYDVEGVDDALYQKCLPVVFSEPQVDVTYTELPQGAKAVFAVEYLPGQYDQRAASCEECIQLVGQCARPTVRSARVYLLDGDFTADELARVKKHVINPVEAREADLGEKTTLQQQYDTPDHVETLTGFTAMNADEVDAFVKKYGLAMDDDDLAFCRDYFASEHRDPTLTEIRMIDTYWSDHCRHTTFLTTLDAVDVRKAAVEKAFQRYLAARKTVYGDRERPMNLMDIATIGGKYLKKIGQTPNIDVSEEINACSIKIDVDVDGVKEPWLLMFKNETHNHPTEIEPFGGAATCIGGAIRDPLSGRTYVYQAMRVTGAADPLVPVSQTMPGKLPQRKLVTTAAAGYSSYGNQIGLATGLVDEMYHPGYAAKRLEIGAVVGAAPEKNVRREVPAPGDKIVLLGGRTGRDGCGGATGSSKSHKLESIETCGAEVQKGNAPTERKLQRLFRDGKVTRLIKRCNDFGAGGVSVAIGELADGLMIDLDKVPKKYDGLDGTELAISESQERMAVVLAPEDVDAFLAAANRENLEATVVAEVTAEPRLRMTWKGVTIVDLSREFLNSNGAEKHTTASVPDDDVKPYEFAGDTVTEKLADMLGNLNICSKQGLSERFDSTIGAATVLMPFGGKYQLTPNQTMVAKLPVRHGVTDTVSGMAYGCTRKSCRSRRMRAAIWRSSKA